MNHPISLTSPAFDHESPIPRRHTGDGEDLSPPLTWSSLPPGTQELALIVDDPDAPTGEPWVHWVLYQIPVGLAGIPEGVHQVERPPFPADANQGINGWGTIGYRGPAPPRGHGAHHYHFTLFALDAPLRLVPGLTKRSLQKAMVGHVLGRGELVGTHERDAS